MKRTWMRHAVAATALAAALALAAPARAAAGPDWEPVTDLVHAAWSWLAGLWGTPRGTEPPEQSAPARQKEGSCVNPMGGHLCNNQKNGGGIDPNGQTHSPAPPSHTQGDNSGGIDPNG